mgnify:FL=1
MKSNIQIKHLDRLQKTLDRLDVMEQDTVLQEAIANGAQVAVDAAKLLVPVDTGDLRDSLHVGGFTRLSRGWRRIGNYGSLGLPGGKAKAYAVLVGTTLPHGRLVEMGTKRTRPKPYLRPAVDGNVDRINDTIDDTLQQICDEA